MKLSARRLFVAKSVSLIIVWKLAQLFLVDLFIHLNKWLTDGVGAVAAGLANLLGRSSYYYGGHLFIENFHAISIADGCNGLELHAMFVGFILLAPGLVLAKIVYCITGLFLIFFANVMRVYLLGLNFTNNPATFEFNHKYTYTLLVYLVVFALWMFWIEVINKKSLGVPNS